MDLLEKYLRNAKKSLFRYEALQDYSAEDGTKLVRDFLKTGDIGPKASESEWWNWIKKLNDSGITTKRVRMVTEPMTDYTKWELSALKEASEYSGDEIRVIGKEDLSLVVQDFWLIDDTFPFLMYYGNKGKYIKSKLSGTRIDHFIDLKNYLLKNSVSINDFLL
jgi:hypothetical protein